MDVPEAASSMPIGFDPTMAEEYTSLSKSLLEFTTICSIDKTWVFDSGSNSKAMFSINQPNLVTNSMRKSVLSAHIRKVGNGPVSFEWSAFPVEITGVSVIVPSPSGSKLLMVRNPVNESSTKFEIWGPSAVEKEFHIPQSVHGSVYCEGWFEGVSWNEDESLIAYVAEEPSPPKPTFNMFGYENEVSSDDKNGISWKGQGGWEEDWGETYENQRRPTLFVINVDSGEVRTAAGIKRSMSVGQVLWAPEAQGSQQHLVFVGWLSDSRKLGMESCFNRPSALYAVQSPFNESKENSEVMILTEGINSAFFPKLSPDGKFLIFISAKACIDSGVLGATDSLHRIDWPSDGKLPPSPKIVDVVPVVMCPDDGCFPGLYWPKFSQKPWLSDGHTVILSSIWGSTQVILSVDILSGNVSRVTPEDSTSWNLLSLDEDNIIAVCGSLVELPKLKYGLLLKESSASASWSWQDVSSPIFKCSKQVELSLSRLRFCIMKIPVRGISENSPEGASKPFDAIFVSEKTEKNGSCNPLIVVLHGGPHSVITSGFSKYLGFLSSIGYNLLIVNYRGSLGMGEDALQSLPGKIGVQDVGDVLTAIDYIIEKKLADPSKISVLGGSHGGFLTTHLISQAPEKFAAAVAKNPVCNLALMSGTSDIPDWCFVEAYGAEGKAKYTDAPSKEHLNVFYDKSPIALVDKVKTPTLILLGAKDLRVPYPIGVQYSRALKERGVETKLIIFPEDNHGLDKPQCDFESNLNTGVWFKKYCK